ncbi:MAG: tRNA dimethylallyltransferase, partial [Bacteroidota bacterium]
PAIRPRLVRRLETEGADALYAELQRADPAFAETLDPTKSQRLLRGLEVYEGTGRPLSSFFTPPDPGRPTFQLYVLDRPREVLYARINERVDQMLEAGLLDEVQGLLDAGIDFTLSPLQTIGYREPLQFLRGDIDRAEMVRLLKRNTRRYAKRQLTWWRRYPNAVWIEL